MVNSLGFARRAVAGVATAAILATQLVSAPFAAAQSAEFSDVSMDNFAYDSIYALVDMGIVSGNPDGTFRPNAYLNRAEMAKIAVKLAAISGVIADANDISNAPSFTDVPSDAWFYGYVSAASKNGIFEGYRDAAGNLTGMFGAADTVLRAQAAKVLMIASGVPSKMTPAAPFVDVNPSDWFYGYVTSAYNWSVLDGYKDAAGNLTGYFGPADPVTRAQVSKIAVQSQNPVDRYTGETPMNENTNMTNMNVNSGSGTNMNSNVVMSSASFEAALSSSTPTGVTLATGTAFNTVAKIDLTAGNQEDVKVTGFTVMHRGLSPDSVVNGVLVVDKDGMRHGNIVSFSDSKAVISFASNPITVAMGTTHTVAIQTNFNVSNTTGTYKVEVTAVSATGASTAGVVNTMGLPVAGPEYSLVTGSNIAAVKVSKGTEQGGQTLDLGMTNRPVASFKIEETSSREAIKVNEITVYNNGTSADGDVKNLKLVDQAGVVLATVDQTSNRYATFKFATPYEIAKGNSRTLDLRVDVMNGSSRTVEYQILNDYDVKVMGSASQAYLLPVAGTSFPLSGSALSTISEGSLILSRSTASPSGEISNGTDDTVLAEFTAQAFGEDIELQNGQLTLDWNSATLGNPNPTTGSVRLVTGSGQTIHSISATDFVDNVALTSSAFNSTYTVKAGTKTTLRIIANMKSNASNGDTVIAKLGQLKFKKLSSNKYNTPALEPTVNGNMLTVSTATITVSMNTSTASQDIVAGGVEQAIAALNIKATNSGSVSVTSLKVDIANSGNITNLRLKNGSTMLGTAIATPTATANPFSFAGQLTVAAGQTVTLMLYADVKTSAVPAQVVTVTIPTNGVTGTAKNTDVTAPAAPTVLQNYTIVAAGTITLSGTATVSNSRVVTAGASNEAILSFKAKAADREDMTLNKLTVKINNVLGTNTPGSVVTVALKKDGVDIATPATLISAGGIYSVEFTGLNQTIARNAEVSYTVAVNLTSTSNAFVSGGKISADIIAYEATGKASGQLNNDTNLATSEVAGTVQLTLHKVTPVVAKQAMSTSAVAGPETTVAKFSVTASGTEAMTLKTLNFNVSGSRAAGHLLQTPKLYRVSGGNEVLLTTTGGNEGAVAAGMVQVVITGGDVISAGETVVYVLKANTTGIQTGLQTPATLMMTMRAVDTGTPANSGVVYAYTGLVGDAYALTNLVEFDRLTF